MTHLYFYKEVRLVGGFKCVLDWKGVDAWYDYVNSNPIFRMLQGLIVETYGAVNLDEYKSICEEIRDLENQLYYLGRNWYMEYRQTDEVLRCDGEEYGS